MHLFRGSEPITPSKVRHARGGGGSRRCDSLWQREGSRACDVTLIKKIYHTYETWNLKWCLTSCCNMYSDAFWQKGERTKTTPDKTFQTKDPWKTPEKNHRKQLSEILYRGLLSGFFVLGLLKIGGVPRCVTYFWWVPGCVTKCDRGEGWLKLAKNSLTYFMDGP